MDRADHPLFTKAIALTNREDPSSVVTDPLFAFEVDQLPRAKLRRSE
ncbi:MAG: hypothetical protein WD206_05080 [Actinomycetota bacterium]